MTGRSVLTEVVTERIGASQDLRAPVVEPPPPPPKTKKRRRVRRFLARVVLRRKSEEQPAPKIMGRKPLAFAVAAREAETGSLEPFLFRTYPREQGTAPGRSDVKLWQAVAATCAAPAVLRPSRSMGRVMWTAGSWPMILHCWLSRKSLPVSGTARRGRGFFRMRPDLSGATSRERGERRWFRRRKSKKPREELRRGTERWFRRVGLTWDHEPRIRRRARLALQRRKAQYFRVEPPLAAAVSLSETDTSKLESMDANVKEWLTSPVVAGRLDEIGRSLERRRVIKEEEEIRYPITANVFRTLNAARSGVGAGVNTLLGDAPQRFRRKTRNIVVESSRKVVSALTGAGLWALWRRRHHRSRRRWNGRGDRRRRGRGGTSARASRLPQWRLTKLSAAVATTRSRCGYCSRRGRRRLWNLSGRARRPTAVHTPRARVTTLTLFRALHVYRKPPHKT